MDGAIVMPPSAEKLMWANVQLMPDPTILSMETGTRHRTAERVSKQTKALVIAISQRRDVVSLYIEGIKYILEDIPTVLSKANQGLATLEKYRARLDQAAGRLTALEFAGGVALYDALSMLQRAELVTRMATEVERYIIELGAEGRLIEMQLEDSVVGRDGRARRAGARLLRGRLRAGDRALPERARRPRPHRAARLRPPRRAARLRPQDEHARLRRGPARLPRAVGGATAAAAGGAEDRQPLRRSRVAAGAPPTPTWRRSTGWGRPARRRSARAFAGFRRSTSSTVIDEPDGRASGRLYLRRRTSQTTAVEEPGLEDLEDLAPHVCEFQVGDNVVYPTPRSRRGAQAGVAGHDGRVQGLPDDQDPAQRHDRDGPLRERASGGPAHG